MTPAEQRLYELLATAAAVRPVLDDFTRARVAAKLRRDFEAMVERSEHGGPVWMKWEPVASEEPSDDEPMQLDESLWVEHGMRPPEGSRPIPLDAETEPPASPQLPRRRFGWTRRLFLASGLMAVGLGVSLAYSLRAPVEDGQPVVMNPIVAEPNKEEELADLRPVIKNDAAPDGAAMELDEHLPARHVLRPARAEEPAAPPAAAPPPQLESLDAYMDRVEKAVTMPHPLPDEANEYLRCEAERASGLTSAPLCFRSFRERFPRSIYDADALAVMALAAARSERCADALPLLKEYLDRYPHRAKSAELRPLFARCKRRVTAQSSGKPDGGEVLMDLLR